MTQHEISEGFIRLVGRNYFMRLVVDGQKKQRATGTNDPDKAAELLAEWKAEERAGIRTDTRQRYEAIRDAYLKGGKSVQASILRDLDEYFKDIRVSAITVKKLEQFREWRESQDRVLEYKAETVVKEIALRTMKATTGHRKSLSASVTSRKSVNWSMRFLTSLFSERKSITRRKDFSSATSLRS